MRIILRRFSSGSSARPLSPYLSSKTIALQILEDELLSEHQTAIPAVLLCVLGEAEYHDEHDKIIRLKPGDFTEIRPKVKHWVKEINDAQLILIK